MVRDNLIMQNMTIGFRNFTGKETKYNRKGNRNFCVFLNEEEADTLQKAGWNVKWTNTDNTDYESTAYMQVTVSYSNIPPLVYLVTSKKKVLIPESGLSMLDWVDIEYVDLIINPYNWTVNGNDGVKAYLKKAYVKIVEDELSNKYEDLPTASMDDNEEETFEDATPPWGED